MEEGRRSVMATTSLKRRLTITIALVALMAIVFISLLTQYFINFRFKEYIAIKQTATTQELVLNLSQQYNPIDKQFNTDLVHTIGMYALYDGYIVKVYDTENRTVWDAEVCDQTTCAHVMEDITQRMKAAYPQLNGKFTANDYPLTYNGETVGAANIAYYGPYFMSKDDFKFLRELSFALAGIAAVALVVASVVGSFMAKRVSSPILRTVEVTRRISDGDYAARIEENASSIEIDQLVGSINRLADSLGKQESLRKQLTADVAHELRTPLATLQTHMEAMTEGIWQPTPARLQSCHEEIVRITRLVKDLESLARAESENLNLSKAPVNLVQIAAQVIKSLELQVKQKALTVSLHGACGDILADGDRLTQVVLNLFSNAVKYTPEGGRIDLTLSEDDRSVTLMVEDNGCGIAEEDLPLIFERFYRADKSRSRLTGGSGIGLAIVKSIVSAHGGTIAVTSAPGKGSRFTVTLPK